MENRRDFIKKASLLTGALGMAGVLPPAVQRALAIDPAPGSTFMDAEHIVLLMQENRSFDHAFGTLKGVRGFNDPRAIRLPDGYPVWLQRNKMGHTYAPFRLNIKDTKATWMSALPHSWENQVAARNDGRNNGWLDAKRSGNKEYADMPLTMGYYNREDIPFYYALADAFTVCDHNFCSSLTGTSTNRCFFWTGKIREEQNAQSKPHLSNGDIDGPERLSWSTFPERLSANGVDWKIYQNELSVGVDLEGDAEDWLANFTDNDMEFFKQYHVRRHPEHLVYLKKMRTKMEQELAAKTDAKLKERLAKVIADIEFLEKNPLEALSGPEQDLHRRAFVTNRNDPDYHTLETVTYDDNGTQRTVQIPKGDVLHQFRADVDSGKLPTVSWLVAPCNFSDHPGAPWYGAWYLSEAIDILTKNPEVWKKTIFILTYDENDGYFDHIPPFSAPDPNDPSTGRVSASLDIDPEFAGKEHSERPSTIGLGFRVPMVVVSPWSRGGYVNSQVFDHTSSIRFLEKFLSHKTGKKITEDNISSWRRSLCGDLTSVFRPYHGEQVATPAPVERIPFLESIHKAKFAKLPDGFRSLTDQDIQEVIKDPVSSPLLPGQEPGIKPSNVIPYEIYTEGALSGNRSSFELAFKSGTAFFGNDSSGVGFNVYGMGKYLAFTAAAGDTLRHQWPLNGFPGDTYDLTVYSVNGYFRAFKGNAQDPEVSMALLYAQGLNGKPTGNVTLHIKRLVPGAALVFNVKDAGYGLHNRKITLKQGQQEIKVAFDLGKSHHWYDLQVSMAGNPVFMRHYAGHVDGVTGSFTDPLMGRV